MNIVTQQLNSHTTAKQIKVIEQERDRLFDFLSNFSFVKKKYGKAMRIFCFSRVNDVKKRY